MKTTIALVFSILCCSAYAECTKEQNNKHINVKINHIANGVKAGGNHGYMDVVHIEVPAIFEGIPLTAMDLSEGEVSSFFVPVAFKLVNGVAKTTISGYKESIKGFEISFHYESKKCNRSFVGYAI